MNLYIADIDHREWECSFSQTSSSAADVKTYRLHICGSVRTGCSSHSYCASKGLSNIDFVHSNRPLVIASWIWAAPGSHSHQHFMFVPTCCVACKMLAELTVMHKTLLILLFHVIDLQGERLQNTIDRTGPTWLHV